MKKCSKCGALQSDDRTLCVDCGSLLGTPMSEVEKARVEEILSNAVDDMAARAEEFYVSPLSRVLGVSSILAAVVLILLIILLTGQLDALRAEIPDGVIVQQGNGAVTILGAEDADMAQVQRILREEDALGKTVVWAVVGAFCFVMAALFFLIPKIMWYLGTLRYRLWFDGEPSPSYLSLVMGRVVTYLCFAIGTVSLVMAVGRLL